MIFTCASSAWPNGALCEKTGRGVVCLISNYSWLDGLSFTGMRERYLEAFDRIWIDCLNGDKYKTGKLTPEGEPDPSVFSTEFNREGIQVGTAIALLVRSAGFQPAKEDKGRQDAGVTVTLLFAMTTSPFAAEDIFRIGKWKAATYSVTFRLAIHCRWPSQLSIEFERKDIVKTAKQQLGRDLTTVEKTKLARSIRSASMRRSTLGMGPATWRTRTLPDMVTGRFAYFDGQRYQLDCLECNAEPCACGFRLCIGLSAWQTILHSWKSFTSKEANKLLGKQGDSGNGSTYDHLVRERTDLERIVRYVVENPVKAGLRIGSGCGVAPPSRLWVAPAYRRQVWPHGRGPKRKKASGTLALRRCASAIYGARPSASNCSKPPCRMARAFTRADPPLDLGLPFAPAQVDDRLSGNGRCCRTSFLFRSRASRPAATTWWWTSTASG